MQVKLTVFYFGVNVQVVLIVDAYYDHVGFGTQIVFKRIGIHFFTSFFQNALNMSQFSCRECAALRHQIERVPVCRCAEFGR